MRRDSNVERRDRSNLMNVIMMFVLICSLNLIRLVEEGFQINCSKEEIDLFLENV